MINNLIDTAFHSFTFYIIYSIFFRIFEINKYVKKSTLDGTYSDTYKKIYSNHLKGKCILVSLLMGVVYFIDIYTNLVFAFAIAIIFALCIGPIFKRFYPKPESNL